MASFDRRFGHIVVRVVYDGPAGAGKTENLKQLVQTFTSQRRGELSSPRQREESTPYFDWLYLNGGVVAGHALRAQLVTVPGRSVLTRRRWQLVKTADVVVFVCESTARGLKEGRRWLELLRAHLAAAALKPPVIVQANMQDLPDAIPAAELAAALGLPTDGEVVAASATTGTGVRETVVHAIRAAASLAERAIIDRGVDGLPDAEDEDSLLAQLDGSAQMRTVIELEEGPLPPFPDEDVTSGCVWPGTTGRAVLRTLARSLAATGVTRAREQGGDGRIVLKAGDMALRTSTSARYPDLPTARVALLEAARSYVRVGALAAPETTLVLATEEGGATWLWRITRWVPTLRDRLDAASDDAELAQVLGAYARALAEALVLVVRDGVAIDVAPTALGIAGDSVVYLGDEVSAAPDASRLVEQIAEVVARYAKRGKIVDQFVSTLGAALEERRPLLDGVRASLARRLEGAGHAHAATFADLTP
jgi:signal recognition particle receptor subunit beta